MRRHIFIKLLFTLDFILSLFFLNMFQNLTLYFEICYCFHHHHHHHTLCLMVWDAMTWLEFRIHSSIHIIFNQTEKWDFLINFFAEKKKRKILNKDRFLFLLIFSLNQMSLYSLISTLHKVRERKEESFFWRIYMNIFNDHKVKKKREGE